MSLTTARPEVQQALAVAARYGWRVFPVTPDKKTPAIKGWRIKASDDPAVWAGWWDQEKGSYPATLVGVHTGPESDIWVLDVDPKNGGTDSFVQLGTDHDQDWGPAAMHVGSPSGGRHVIYAYPPRLELEKRGRDKVKNRAGVLPGLDVRGHGGLIVAPGQTGREILGDAPAVIGQAPDWLLDLVLDHGAEDGQPEAGDTGAGKTQYSELVSNPPVGQGGRNNWLTAVAGHLAVRENYRDSFNASVEAMNRSLTPPLGQDEVDKICKSIWETELAKSAGNVRQLRSAEGRETPGAELNEEELAEAATALGVDSGGLRPVRRGGSRVGRLELDVNVRQGDKTVRQPAIWANFDAVALGVTSDDSGERFYLVELIRGRDGVARELILPAKALGDRRQLNAWMAQHRVAILEPGQPVLKMGACERLQSYLESQGPPEFTVVDHLGWSNQARAFLTTDGVITADGPGPYGDFRPSKAIMENKEVLYRYGHGKSPEEVRQVLNEILTFHFQDEAAVFGAWWAATLLKHVAMQHSALFPIMAIEAPSESGKTTGMFGMLVRLSGWAGEQSTYTKASFRDALTVNRNGIIWLDDPDSVSNLEEVLRAATAEGAMTKKADDLAHNQNARLISPVTITGEALGFRDQKALRDRAIHLSVQSPTGRKSQRADRAGESQWDDILDFKERVPDLTEYAGTLVQMALQNSAEFARDVRTLRGTAGRRIGDAVAILRAGARLLDRLTGDGGFDDQVGHWLDENGVEDTGNENSLTLKVLPVLLEHVGQVSTPNRENRLGVITPVVVQEGPGGEAEVWVNAPLCAEWWQRLQGGRVVERTETATAFQQQIASLGHTEEKQIRVSPPSGNLPSDRAKKGRAHDERRRYRLLPTEIASRLLDR